jgi:hypothetical protein
LITISHNVAWLTNTSAVQLPQHQMGIEQQPPNASPGLVATHEQPSRRQSVADAIGVCRISWAETIAALACRQREDPNSSADLEEARQHLIHSWSTFSIVEVNQP